MRSVTQSLSLPSLKFPPSEKDPRSPVRQLYNSFVPQPSRRDKISTAVYAHSRPPGHSRQSEPQDQGFASDRQRQHRRRRYVEELEDIS